VNAEMNLRVTYIKCWEFFDELRTGNLLSKDSHPWSKGARGGAVVETLRYKPEGRGFEAASVI
jgi:hypothetical protein